MEDVRKKEEDEGMGEKLLFINNTRHTKYESGWQEQLGGKPEEGSEL